MAKVNLTKKFNALEEAIVNRIAQLMEKGVVTEPIPDYGFSGIPMSGSNVLCNNYEITHITTEHAFDDRGMMFNISVMIAENMEALCNHLDKF